ncbi:helix-turn-helix domain-containing protein [Pseudonocardia endophytica]|uniref:AraC family transcriptional regulator n=1 Tax=Pseudonocardia endophytica TaxID=401976 RepID=A0A4R1HN90_PSEEN|nr:helix-turn-helix transcriptional regulator [Pseudonocardia endophytica]TCK22651.1 AraC family transcriptional regulator [Pseudonocardia endophytica]
MPDVVPEYAPARPPAVLAGHVRRYLGFREFSAAPVRRRQAPVGSCALVVFFGTRMSMRGAFGALECGSFVAGMGDSAVLTEFTGEQSGLQIDLTPLGLYTLLGHSTESLTGRVPALDELGDRALASMPERLAALPGWPARIAHVNRLLAGRMLDDRARHPDPEVRHAWSRLCATAGAVRVDDLAAETGWSRRHLLTRFRDQVGLAPKTTGRVLRFERASGLVVAGTSSLADIAATCGYSDQPHLVREFRALAGVTPTAFRSEWGLTPRLPEDARL